VNRDFDVVIIGAGVIGAAMAALLVARKVCAPGRVGIIAERLAPDVAADAAVDADWDVRVFALSRASERLLRHCGVWNSIPPQRIFAYERMCVWDAGGAPQGPGSLSFDCAEIGEPNLGFIVEGRALQRHCLRQVSAAGVVLIEAGMQGIAVGDAEVRIGLNDGRELRSRLLIAADGTESKSRELLGIGTAGHAYHQDALVAHVRTAKPHQNTAWQRFLATGPLAFLPLPGGRSSIVWSAARAEASRLAKLDPAAFGAALTAASGGVLGEVQVTTPTVSFPLKLQYALDYARPRAVLLGDAAHAVHPLAGQGLNLGLLDCASLAEVLSGAADPRFLGDYKLLRRYERWRRSENLLAATALDGLERLFSNANPAVAGLRAAGLKAVGNLPFMKRQLARRALGLIGDIPSFLRTDSAHGRSSV
jgi:ubiquinone biosynthesis UbiH/UbiF/VisC/COQ6 family hydroxylase